jgi:hypothetical protein
MNSETSRDVEFAMQMVSATELSTVEGGLIALNPYVPFGDRVTDGCGTMILIDRILSTIFGPRR